MSACLILEYELWFCVRRLLLLCIMEFLAAIEPKRTKMYTCSDTGGNKRLLKSFSEGQHDTYRTLQQRLKN